MSRNSDTGSPPTPGTWKYKITARPTLTMYEVVGKTETLVWGTWWNPHAGRKGAPITKTTGVSIRFPPGHKRAGQISPAREEEVKKLASRWHADLVDGHPPGTTSAATSGIEEDERASLTLREGFRKYLDVEEGRYPDASDPERHDVQRAAEEVFAAVEADRPIPSYVPITTAQTIWRHVQKRIASSVEPAQPQGNGRERRNRQRTAGGPSTRGDGAVWAARVVHHLFACMDWLRSRHLIPDGACMRPSGWKNEFRNDWRKLTGRDLDEEREQPRFTAEQAGKLLDNVSDERVDPRLRINLFFGGDSLRSGQVRRAMRSDLDLSGSGEFGLGRLHVRGSGRKKGSLIDLDPVLRRQIDHELTKGYLRECEREYIAGTITDYALMPQGRFVHGATPVRANKGYLKPISRRTLLDYFHFLEHISGVAHIHKRAWYGLRRLWSDLTPEHVKSPRARELMGGWSRGSKVPQQVYESKEDEQAIRESSRARANIREELRTGRLSEITELRVALSTALSHCTDPELLRHLLCLLRAGEFPPTQEAEDGVDA